MLEDLEPKGVFHFFEEITQIPRGSTHVEQISDYLVSFAKERGLRYRQDEKYNVVIFKGGSAGYEEKPPVILQGHMDMVTVKEPDCPKDLLKEGVSLEVHGDLISATGTSLGGDDGIALAYALAILDDDSIAHPPLEVVCTTDEEVGMGGANFLDVSDLKGRTLINIDSENEGIFTVSCAGGATVVLTVPSEREEKESAAVTLDLSGFTGGHSGMEIDKGRANPTKILGELLTTLSADFDLQVISLCGGGQDNAIPTSGQAVIAVNPACTGDLTKAAQARFSELMADHTQTDPKAALQVSVDGADSRSVYTRPTSEHIIHLLQTVPDGVIRMNPDIPGVVQTSLNLGILSSDEQGVQMTFCVRSASDDEKEGLIQTLTKLAEKDGAAAAVQAEYPGWAYREDSPIRDIMTKVYRELYGQDPVIEGIHAGLECGLFCARIPGLDAISIGPQMNEVHSTKEELSIASTQRTWQLLLHTLS